MFGGIDAHKKESVLAVVGPGGKREPLVRVRTTPEGLEQLVVHTRLLRVVVVEASTSGRAVARFLRERGVNAVLIHADALVAAIRKNKSDPLDAYDLARVAAVGAYTPAYVPSLEEEGQRALVVRAAHLRRRMSVLTCQLKALAQAHLVEEPVGKLDTPGCRRRWARLPLPEVQQAMVQSRLQEYEFLHAEWEAVRLRTVEAVQGRPEVELLLTLPGVDVAGVAGLLAFTGPITRFKEASHYASAIGLTPRQHQSGDQDRGGRITKKGHSLLRCLYVELAWQVIRHPSQLRNQFLRLERRKGRKKAIVAIARKLAVVVWHMLTHQQPYQFALEHNATLKHWRLHAVHTLLQEGDRQEAARLLRTHDPHRERLKWERTRNPTPT